MRLRTMPIGALVAASLVGAAAPPDPAREAAKIFGHALVTSDAAKLRRVLPESGKVYLSLSRLGPEEGSFGPGQVEALVGDFLAAGSVRSFDVIRIESDGRSTALVHARALIVDREGRSGRALMHLAFETEGDRWVLREIKETAE
jgi:hypothetical protein